VLSWQMAYVTFGVIMVVLGLVALFVIMEDENKVEDEMKRTGRGDQAHVAPICRTSRNNSEAGAGEP